MKWTDEVDSLTSTGVGSNISVSFFVKVIIAWCSASVISTITRYVLLTIGFIKYHYCSIVNFADNFRKSL